MKNKEILMDLIGETDEELIPDLSKKEPGARRIIRMLAAGGVCAAAAMGCVFLLNRKANTGTPESAPHSDSAVQPGTAPQAARNAVPLMLAAAVYPDMPAYPTGDNMDEIREWNLRKRELQNQPEGYQNGFDVFFANSTRTILNGAGSENRVYSPLSLYMALSMSAEVTSGSSRQQILDALAQPDIDTLRTRANAIWQANYSNDGMATCVLANSLWMSSGFNYNQNTIQSVADHYYASSFSGSPSSADYNKMLQDWLNEQTGSLLTDYVSDIKMDPNMVLTLVSTVNFSGKWCEPFNQDLTAPAAFHAVNGDMQCDFMHREGNMDYTRGGCFTAVSMPLEHNGKMRLILPDEGISPEALLNETEVMQYLTNGDDEQDSRNTAVRLSVPRFDVSSGTDLRDCLMQMGITDIFDDTKSDFSPLSDTKNLAVARAEQDTRVMIDEDGCKAASLTALMVNVRGVMLQDYTEVVLDRPFLFEIVSETGLPLFVGIVSRPVS